MMTLSSNNPSDNSHAEWLERDAMERKESLERRQAMFDMNRPQISCTRPLGCEGRSRWAPVTPERLAFIIKGFWALASWVFIMSFCCVQVIANSGLYKQEANSYLDTHPDMVTFGWVFMAIGFLSSFFYLHTEDGARRSPDQSLYVGVSGLSITLLPLIAILASNIA